jgi:hypothetical protein
MVKEMEGREGAVVVLDDEVYTPSTIATQEEAAQVMPTANGASEIKEADDVLNAFSTCAKKP